VQCNDRPDNLKRSFRFYSTFAEITNKTSQKAVKQKFTTKQDACFCIYLIISHLQIEAAQK